METHVPAQANAGEDRFSKLLLMAVPWQARRLHLEDELVTGKLSCCKSDSEGIRTPVGRAQWISSPSP